MLKYSVVVFKVSFESYEWNKFDLNNYSILVQERLTREIAEAIKEAINPHGVGVIVECVYVIHFLEEIYLICLFFISHNQINITKNFRQCFITIDVLFINRILKMPNEPLY